MTVAMKANRIHRFGGPEVILFEDVPRPTPGTGEVLVSSSCGRRRAVGCPGTSRA